MALFKTFWMKFPNPNSTINNILFPWETQIVYFLIFSQRRRCYILVYYTRFWHCSFNTFPKRRITYSRSLFPEFIIEHCGHRRTRFSGCSFGVVSVENYKTAKTEETNSRYVGAAAHCRVTVSDGVEENVYVRRINDIYVRIDWEKTP